MGLFGRNKKKEKEVETQKETKKSKGKAESHKTPVAVEEEQPACNLFGKNGSVIQALDIIQLKSFANDETSPFLFVDLKQAPKSKTDVQRVRAYFLSKYEKDARSYKTKCNKIHDEIKTKKMSDVKAEIEVGRHYALDLVLEKKLDFVDFVKFYQELGNKTSDIDRKYLAILVKLRAVLLEIGVEDEDFLRAYKEAIKDGYTQHHQNTVDELFGELQGILNKLNEDYDFDDELWEYFRVALVTGQNIKVAEEPEEDEVGGVDAGESYEFEPDVPDIAHVPEEAQSDFDFEGELPEIQDFDENLSTDFDFEQDTNSEATGGSVVKESSPVEEEEEPQKSITVLLKMTPAMQFVFLSQVFKKLISELISSSEIKLNSDAVTVMFGDTDYQNFTLTRETFDEFSANVTELKDDLCDVFFAPALKNLEENLEANKVYVVIYDYVVDKKEVSKMLSEMKAKLDKMNSTIAMVCVECPGAEKSKDALVKGINHVYLDKDLAFDTLKLTDAMSKLIY